jgi:hypothetical protein
MKRRLWGSTKIILAVSFLCICILAGAGLAGTTEPLPAQQWNQENLSKITGLNAEPLTFAVLGDNRDNPEGFGKVLRQMDLDQSLTFAIHLGDMVKNADLAQYRIFFEKVRRYYPKPLVTVIGNHELYGERGLELYHDLFGQDYYSFQVGGNYFIMVDDAAKEVWTPEQVR